MAKVLIVGCGDIGLDLAEVLIAEGHQVAGLKRKPLNKDLPGLTLFLADITVADELVTLPTDFDQIYVILSPDRRDEESYRRVYQQGIDNLLSYFASANDSNRRQLGQERPSQIKPNQEKPSPHWIFVSSTSVYGQTAGEWVDEGSPTEPSGFNGKALLQAEQRILAAGSNNTIVRFSGIYGPGRESLIKGVQSGVPVQYEPPYYTNRIHRDDCIGVLAWLLNQRLTGSPVDNIYLASDGNPAPIMEVACWLAEKLNCAAPPAKQSTNSTQNKRCTNHRLCEQGYEFRFNSYREGYGVLFENA